MNYNNIAYRLFCSLLVIAAIAFVAIVVKRNNPLCPNNAIQVMCTK